MPGLPLPSDTCTGFGDGDFLQGCQWTVGRCPRSDRTVPTVEGGQGEPTASVVVNSMREVVDGRSSHLCPSCPPEVSGVGSRVPWAGGHQQESHSHLAAGWVCWIGVE